MYKKVPIYIVFESSIIKQQSARDFINRILERFKIDPYALSDFWFGIVSYDVEVTFIRNLSPIDEIDKYRTLVETQLNLFGTSNFLSSLDNISSWSEPDFYKMVSVLSTELSKLNYKEWHGPIIYLITHCQDETTYYKGFSELHDRHKDLEICHINLCPMPRIDVSINIDSLDDIDSIGYSLVNYYDGGLDCYYPKTEIRRKNGI